MSLFKASLDTRDLEKACARRGTPIRIAISVERDRYPKHHRGHGGVALVDFSAVPAYAGPFLKNPFQTVRAVFLHTA